MTAKEEATELVDRFKQYSSGNVGGDSEKYTAKQCALICVDEMIKHNGKYYLLNGGELVEKIYRKENGHLFEVKKEIQKL